MKGNVTRFIFTGFLVFYIASGVFSNGNAESKDVKKSDSIQIFKTNVPSEPSILDPAQFRDDNASSIIYALHEPILRYSPAKQGWEPGLATSVDISEDGLVYTIHLRDKLKWEDGTEITADDIVYSYRRYVDPEFASPKAFDYYDILNGEAIVNGNLPVEDYGVKAVDKKTVEITLGKKADYFFELLKNTGFAPIQKTAGEKYGSVYGTEADKVVASGPFKIKTWEHESKIILVKNENYWDATNVSLGMIDITMIKDENTLVGLYKTDELDTMNVAANYLPRYKDTADFRTLPLARVQFIEFNPSWDYLKNIKIREALSIAFNRTAYVEEVLASGDIPAYGLVPPKMNGLDGGDFREQNGNLVLDMGSDPTAGERAVKLLEKGLSELGKTKQEMADELDLLCVDSPNSKRLAQAIQYMWHQTLGLELKVTPMQVKMLIPLLMNSEFPMVVGGGRTATTLDPAAFIDFIYYEGKWKDDTYINDLLEKAINSAGNDRIKLLMDAEKYILKKFVFIPQNYPVANYVIRDYVEGFRRYAVGVDFDYKYIKITK